jgi:hypothetical protein
MATDIEQAVEAAFTRLALVYGTHAMSRMWLGQDLPTVKRAWCHELRGFTSLDVIWAMDHLPPEGIPNLLQFKALCQRRPEPALLALKGPPADPARVVAVIAELQKLKATLTNGNRATDWQLKLIERYRRGDKGLTLHQRHIAEELLEARRARESRDA